eukprot:m51a1_g4224 hypothetical protein (591) ;mRNA; f:100006-102032
MEEWAEGAAQHHAALAQAPADLDRQQPSDQQLVPEYYDLAFLFGQQQQQQQQQQQPLVLQQQQQQQPLPSPTCSSRPVAPDEAAGASLATGAQQQLQQQQQSVGTPVNGDLGAADSPTVGLPPVSASASSSSGSASRKAPRGRRGRVFGDVTTQQRILELERQLKEQLDKHNRLQTAIKERLPASRALQGTAAVLAQHGPEGAAAAAVVVPAACEAGLLLDSEAAPEALQQQQQQMFSPQGSAVPPLTPPPQTSTTATTPGATSNGSGRRTQRSKRQQMAERLVNAAVATQQMSAQLELCAQQQQQQQQVDGQANAQLCQDRQQDTMAQLITMLQGQQQQQQQQEQQLLPLPQPQEQQPQQQELLQEVLQQGVKEEEQQEQEPLYCLCRSRWDGRTMIMCSFCQNWYHPECVGVAIPAGPYAEQAPLVCPVCQQQQQQQCQQAAPQQQQGQEEPDAKRERTDVVEWGQAPAGEPVLLALMRACPSAAASVLRMLPARDVTSVACTCREARQFVGSVVGPQELVFGQAGQGLLREQQEQEGQEQLAFGQAEQGLLREQEQEPEGQEQGLLLGPCFPHSGLLLQGLGGFSIA